jgi:hypothetical protein
MECVFLKNIFSTVNSIAWIGVMKYSIMTMQAVILKESILYVMIEYVRQMNGHVVMDNAFSTDLVS